MAIYIPAEIIRALNLSGGGRLRPCYGGRRRPSERRLVEVVWPWAIKEACSFEVSRSLPSTAAATQLARRKTGSRRWRSSSLITVAVCFFFIFFFFSQTCSRLFLFWCVRTPQRTTQARSEVKFEAKKTKQNVPHYAKLECRSRTEKVLSYVKFTLEGEKKTQGNQRSHILYNPSLRFSHRCEGKC